MAEQVINGHAVDYLNHRYECTRCRARLLSIMQFQGRECPGPRETTEAEEGDHV